MDKKTNKVIEIPEEEFEALLKKLKDCEADRKKLIAAIEYLNNQIDEFNKKFSSAEEKNND